MASAWADGTTVTFRVPDPGYRLAAVRLSQDVRIPGDQLDFRLASQGGDGEGWELAIGQPPVTRMEYLLELRYRDGGAGTVTDPGNPRHVDGAFGRKAVLEFAAYRPPGWLTAATEPGRGATFEVPAASLDAAIGVRTWAPADASDDEMLPLLVVHDGPEYDALAGLTGYLAAGVAGRWLPRLRAALLSPGPRDDWYSAHPHYAEALTRDVLKALDARLATHTHDPAAFAGLFLQSGSWFGYYPHALNKLRYPAELHELPDMHNYTAWRDAFDPHLTRLIGQACG